VVAYLARFGVPTVTHNTIAEAAAFMRELAAVRECDDSLDLEEFALGVCCIGAPIVGATGRVVAALSIVLPASRDQTGAEVLVRHLGTTAEAATRALTVLGDTASAADAVS
jgi:DNA-binding IclR family transcriptional regulator